MRIDKCSVTPQKLELRFQNVQPYTVKVVENDHNALENRDLADQHSITAITGLRDTLDEIDRDLTDHGEDLNGCKEELAKHDEKITAHGEKLDAHSEQIEKNVGRLDEYGEQIEDIGDSLTNSDSQINKMGGQITKVEKQIVEMETQLDSTLEGEVITNSEIEEIWRNIMKS